MPLQSPPNKYLALHHHYPGSFLAGSSIFSFLPKTALGVFLLRIRLWQESATSEGLMGTYGRRKESNPASPREPSTSSQGLMLWRNLFFSWAQGVLRLRGVLTPDLLKSPKLMSAMSREQ